MVALTCVIAVAGSVLYGWTFAATSNREQSLASQVAAACAGGGDTARQLAVIGACRQAAQVQADPVPGPIGATGPQGVPGQPGVQGPQGVPGQRGADSTVPGPTGPAGADGEPGKPGADGAEGKPGADGAAGTPGAPGRPPAGFTFTDPAGRTQTCTRDPGSPDDAATYTCTTPSSVPTSMRLVDLRQGAR